MPVINLDDQQAQDLIVYLASLSDRLTAQHQEEHSGVAQFLLLSTIQGVDRLYQEIRSQVEPESEHPVPPVESLVW